MRAMETRVGVGAERGLLGVRVSRSPQNELRAGTRVALAFFEWSIECVNSLCKLSVEHRLWCRGVEQMSRLCRGVVEGVEGQGCRGA